MSESPVAAAAFPAPTLPFEKFVDWLDLATKNEINDPNAMALATVGEDGMPSVRTMYLKKVDQDGFVFYANRLSKKGRQLAQNPRASMCFHWKSLRRQVLIEGAVEPISDEESDAYFASRPRGAQITTWASVQSQPLYDRDELQERVRIIEERYAGLPVPRPSFWSGLRLVPNMIEFWQDGTFKLHNRLAFKRSSPTAPWTQEFISP